MIKPRYIVGIVGRRHLNNPDVVSGTISQVLKELKDIVAQRGGRLELYGSIAYGADTLAVQEAHKLDIPIHLILPKPVVRDENGAVIRRAGFAADFWQGSPEKDGVFLEAEWNASLVEIELAAAGHNGGSLRLTEGSQNNPECYYDAGLQVLESADVLLAVLDDQPDKGLAGARGMAKLADQQNLPVVIVSALGGETERRRLDALAAPDEEGLKVIKTVDTFSESCAPSDHAGGESAELFARLAACSKKESVFFRLSLVRTIQWHGIATLVAAVAAVLPQTSLVWKCLLAVLAVTELVFVVNAFRRVRRLHKDHTHKRWMQTRFAAELMRAMRHSAGLLDPLHPLIARHHPHWRRFAITAGLMIQRDVPHTTWESARKLYIQNRLCHEDPHIGQISYFTRKQAEAEPHFKRTTWWGRVLGVAAMIAVFCAVLFKIFVITAKATHIYYPKPVDSDHADVFSWIAAFSFSFLPIALPLATGVFISLRIALDSGRRTYRYRELAERLTAAAATLKTLETESAVRRTVASTEEILLDELVEWHLAEQQNGAH